MSRSNESTRSVVYFRRVGGDAAGAGDDDLAVNAALQAGTDLVFATPGTYRIDLTHAGTGYISANGITPRSSVKVECTAFNSDGTPAVHLIRTSTADNTAIIALKNPGDTVCGCDFRGPDISSYSPGSGVAGDQLLTINNNSETVEDNTFEGCHGNSAIQVSEFNTGVAPNNVLVQYNTCGHNGNYGWSTDDTSGGIARNNYIVDSSWGLENDACNNIAHFTTNVIIRDNWLHVTGRGPQGVRVMVADFPSAHYSGFNNCDYRTSTFSNNKIDAVAGQSVQYLSSDNGNLPCADRAAWSVSCPNLIGPNGSWPDLSEDCGQDSMSAFATAH